MRGRWDWSRATSIFSNRLFLRLHPMNRNNTAIMTHIVITDIAPGSIGVYGVSATYHRRSGDVRLHPVVIPKSELTDMPGRYFLLTPISGDDLRREEV